MARTLNKLLPTRKFRMLRVKQILEDETDSRHSITMTRLLELLNENSESDRRTLYEDIRDLEYLGTKVKIDKSKTPPHLNVTEREFSISELKLIIDAIASSKFLTKSASQALIDKLKAHCSHYEADELNRQTLLANRTKRVDDDFHNNVGTISLAIDTNRQITFSYFRISVRKRREYNKKPSVVSPWAMIYAEDNYYMMAFDGKMMRYYRADRMDKIRILQDTRLGEEEYAKIKDEMPFRTQSTFNLFGGEKEYVTLKCPSYYFYIIQDKFGSNIQPVIDKGGETFTVTVPVCIGDPFFGWIVSMGNKVVIQGPPEVKRKMAELLYKVERSYLR